MAIQNAASGIEGAVAPGENIVLYGTGIGPAGSAVLGSMVNNALATTVANTRVLFDGVPAHIYYTSSGQTSVFVPYGIVGQTRTRIVVEVQGVQSNPTSPAVSLAVPGVYTLNQSGSGPGVIWNFDLNGNYAGINSTSNPVVRGAVIAVYVTGEGRTNEPGNIDGMAVTNLYKPLAEVTATVGGQPAIVEYAGSAPGSIYGVMQVNLRIPTNAPTGANVPIIIAVGSASTQPGVTLAVR